MQTLHSVSPIGTMSSSNASSFLVQQGKAQLSSSSVVKSDKNKKGKGESDKPKRPLSAYNLFFQHERAQILKSTPSKYDGSKPRRSHGKIGFGALARSVAAKWNNIDPEQRKHFDELAAADKQRYKKEMEAWKSSQALMKKQMSSAAFGGSMASSSSPSMIMSSSPPTMNAQSIVKCNLMAAQHAPQNSGRMVFNRMSTGGNMPASHCGNGNSNRASMPPSARFFFQNLPGGSNITPDMRSGNASDVVGQALAMLEQDIGMPSFQPLDAPTLERVESEESSLTSSSTASSSTGQRRGSVPDISELAAKLDDDCLGFMSGLLF